MRAFDTLTYAKKLREAGFTEAQAEAQAEALRAVVEENLATRQDIEAVRRDIEQLRQESRRDIEHLRREFRQELGETEARLRYEVELVRRDVVIRLGGLIVAATAVLAVLMRLL